MKEELVSIETAILAYKIGFNIPCIYFIDKEGDISSVMDYIGDTFEDKFEMAKEFIVMFLPTQSLLQKYLREMHNLNVNVNYYDDKITPIRWAVFIDTNYIPCKGDTYEQALEKGLQEALNTL